MRTAVITDSFSWEGLNVRKRPYRCGLPIGGVNLWGVPSDFDLGTISSTEIEVLVSTYLIIPYSVVMRILFLEQVFWTEQTKWRSYLLMDESTVQKLLKLDKKEAASHPWQAV